MRSIKVGPRVFTVSYARADVLEASYEMSGQLAGYCNKPQERIVIDKTYAPGYVRDTHLHEALHAVIHVYSLDDMIRDEEEFVSRFTPALIALLRDNPQLVRLLLADETRTRGTA